MARNKETQKLVVIETIGTINELGGISGPVLNPSLQPISTLVRMVYNRKKVYEVNPNNYNDRVLLTLKNVRANNFPESNNKVKANVQPTSTATKTTVVDKKEDTVDKKEETTVFTKEKKDNKSDFTKK